MNSGWLQDNFKITSGYIQDVIRKISGWLQDNFRITSGWIQDNLRMTSGWLQDNFRMNSWWFQDDFRMTSGWLQDDFKWIQDESINQTFREKESNQTSSYSFLLRYRYRFTSIDLFENFYILSCVQFFCHISALLANIPIQIILIHSSVYHFSAFTR